MFEKTLGFIERHYIFSVCIVAFFCISGIAFAANPDLFEYIFTSQHEITDVDNTVIVGTDIDQLNTNVEINSIREDENTYHIDYNHDTLAIADGFWRKVSVDKTLTIDKRVTDKENLGLYVARKLSEDLNFERFNLKKIQELERSKGRSRKIITTKYSGFIGGFFDAKKVVIDDNVSIYISGENSSIPDVSQETIVETVTQMLLSHHQTPSLLISPPPSSSASGISGSNSGVYTSSTSYSSSSNNQIIPSSSTTTLPSPPPPTPQQHYESGPDIVNVGPVPE